MAGKRASEGVGLWGWVMRALGVGCPLALLALALAFRYVGERWWVTTAALYLPRGYLAIPAAAVALALAVWGPRKLLLAQLVSAAVLIFPLLGLNVSRTRTPAPGAPRMRVLSYNVATGSYGAAALTSEIVAAAPDVVLLQESQAPVVIALRAALPDFTLHVDAQFVVASRWPIADITAEPTTGRWPTFIRYRVTTPAGPIRVYNVHPVSPHNVLEEMLGQGLRHELASGRLLQMPAAAGVAANAAERTAELRAVATDAAGSTEPVLIAGDTNSPGLSWALADALGGYQDGFTVAGSGLGYTFPGLKRPWMRLDRVLADRRWRFLRFEVMARGASDHRGVIADLEMGAGD